MADRPVSVKEEQPLRSKDVKVRPAAKQIWKEKCHLSSYTDAHSKNTNQEEC